LATTTPSLACAASDQFKRDTKTETWTPPSLALAHVALNQVKHPPPCSPKQKK
jgi:hypothetical protein